MSENAEVKVTKRTPKAKKVELTPPKPRQGEKTKTPKQLATQWKMDPKRLRRVMRELWGTHFQRWEITPSMEKELKKALKIK